MHVGPRHSAGPDVAPIPTARVGRTRNLSGRTSARPAGSAIVRRATAKTKTAGTSPAARTPAGHRGRPDVLLRGRDSGRRAGVDPPHEVRDLAPELGPGGALRGGEVCQGRG